jgi:hypothetical protein
MFSAMKLLKPAMVEESSRTASTPGRKMVLTRKEYAQLNKDLNQAMAEVFVNRVGELPGVTTRKSFGNAIVAYEFDGKSMYSFIEVRLPYVFVSDKFSITGYGHLLSLNMDSATASVVGDARTKTSDAWARLDSFCDEGRSAIRIAELTVAGATRTANALVDAVKAHRAVVMEKAEEAISHVGLPFMTFVAGHVIIHDDTSGNPLPEDWSGICVDGSNTKKFWYIGRSKGERSFSALRARSPAAAKEEAEPIIEHEFAELGEMMLFGVEHRPKACA